MKTGSFIRTDRQADAYTDRNLALWLAGRRVDPCKQHLDEELDEALEETFPASDPIAVTPSCE